MRIDANGKVWATWREWMKMGKEDSMLGRPEPRFPNQPDYMAGYNHKKRTTPTKGE